MNCFMISPNFHERACHCSYQTTSLALGQYAIVVATYFIMFNKTF